MSRGLLLAAALLAAATMPALAFERAATYPEGPLALGARTFVAEMPADRVAVFEDGAWREFWRHPGCGPTSIAPFGEGFAVTCHLGRALAIVSREGRTLKMLTEVAGGQPNDSSADDAGGVYVSSPGPFTKLRRFDGAIIRLAPDGAVTVVADGLWYPNGVHFDAGKRALYVSEHLGRKVWRYPVLDDGRLGVRTLFADIDALAPAPDAPPYREAGPDGLERAANGDLVVALYGESRLAQFTPQGKLRRTIPLRLRFVTNLAFLDDGSAVVVGAHDNAAPDLPGEILRLPAETFRAR